MSISSEDMQAIIAGVLAALKAGGVIKEIPAASTDEPDVAPVEEDLPTCVIGGRLMHYRPTGRTFKYMGQHVPSYELVDDIDFPWTVEVAPARVLRGNSEEYTEEIVDLPLRMTGALFFFWGGILMANMFRDRPWKGVYHPQGWTKTAYSVLMDTDHVRELYGTLPDEPDVVDLRNK